MWYLCGENFSKCPASDEQPLFLLKKQGKLSPLLYGDLLKFLKEVFSKIGLKPEDVGLHSLRRSGAAFLHHLKVPLEDIRCIGDWRSMAVLTYLITPPDRKASIEQIVSEALSSMLTVHN